ncbi:hypothetical protein L202_04879 [Cryptococcus amylolentus CBS 6039]|uniref:Transcription factor BYE1 n=2 Tax=Cryptococcus amylolentus CBS 6039 TaxID=1295533 RepID=A0A1E3HN15_9TREE|nr:hypothetical protein L202_04879 [Cryptococcus amylolentus CBS 6039]ODN77740.1 hypothetical protein L202_04879 [Cryptococcus amylolentus CBS 6039]
MADITDLPSPRAKRSRVKSQKVLENEETRRALHAAQAAAAAYAPSSPAPPAQPRAKRQKKEADTYCLCKKDTEGPMIECDHCNDWYHFVCIHMHEAEAERIHSYICPLCSESTTMRTTYINDISTYASPSPPAGLNIAPSATTKRKKKAVESPATPTHSSPSGSSHRPSNSSRSPSPPESPALKRQRVPSTSKPTPVSAKRFSTSQRKTSLAKADTAALPPIRTYVRSKLLPLIQNIFEGNMEGKDVEEYVNQVEDAMYMHFREVVKGKETVGNRYKTQFSLLSNSMTKGLRPSLLSSIVAKTLSPSAFALLSSADLASDEQLAAISAAKQAILEQTVKGNKVKEEERAGQAIRIGRDGFEKAEDWKEREMREVMQVEDREKRRDEEAKRKREMMDVDSERMVHTDLDERPVSIGKSEPTLSSRPEVLPKRSSSTTVKPVAGSPQSGSPSVNRPTFALQSAWSAGSGSGEHEHAFLGSGAQDQGEIELDLGDIAVAEVDVDYSVEYGHTEEEQGESAQLSDMQRFESKTIAWRGGLVNPAAPSPQIPPTVLRLVSPAAPHNQISPLILPHPNIEITGRVPTKNSLKFLSDMRMSPAKELVCGIFSLGDEASEEEKGRWDEMIGDYLSRDRHAIYLPYGQHPLPGAIKEIYMIPLRPTDALPDFTDLIDGLDVPKEGRTGNVFLGVLVGSRKPPVVGRPAGQQGVTPPHDPRAAARVSSASSSHPTSKPSSLPAPPPSLPSRPQVEQPPLPAAVQPNPVAAASPLAGIQNEKLQALMASLNPAALAGLSPPQPSLSTPAPAPAPGGSTSNGPHAGYPQQGQAYGYTPPPPPAGHGAHNGTPPSFPPRGYPPQNAREGEPYPGFPFQPPPQNIGRGAGGNGGNRWGY